MMITTGTRASRCAARALWKALPRRAVPAVHASQFQYFPPSTCIRTHMNHGGDPSLQNGPTTAPGPRTAGIELGLPSATGVHNILRLLESSHGPTSVMSARMSEGYCWHPQGKIWRLDEDTQNWILHSLDNGAENHNNMSSATPATPSLLWLVFSDARTALAKVMGADGYLRYLSILQLDEHKPRNDGWRIVREVMSGGGHNHQTKSFTSVKTTLLDYQAVEHGGGLEDKESAETIFAEQASLLAVGCSEHPHDHEHRDNHHDTNPWEAPAGHFLEIPLTTYLDGVLSQTMHSFEASQHDDIVSIDVMPCGNVAAAVVRVGNGSQTRVFEDHLLLGRSAESGYWKILSKTFSPHPWPQRGDDMTLGAMIEKESRSSS